MMYSEYISIDRRFQRAVRIDTDVNNARALDGFICPQSSRDSLERMANHIKETKHTAFTWTGPYGSGKSSLIVVLSALLNNDISIQNKAKHILGEKTSSMLLNIFSPNNEKWTLLPIVGSQSTPEELFTIAIKKHQINNLQKENPSQDEILVTLTSFVKKKNNLIIFIDELGKILEGAIKGKNDIFFLQQLAEIASRSKGKLVFIGVLHQAFEEYANRMSRIMRDEWSKIQGRFIDLPINTANEETIELISRAIINKSKNGKMKGLTNQVINNLQKNRRDISNSLSNTLNDCWPLHPVVSCLLGPISKRRFGQNQRSVFGFLNSAEPEGFQSFISNSEKGLYTPAKLWDYLRFNLEPSILASPDGHRWSHASEAIFKVESKKNNRSEIQVLKTIAILDLFKERSGLSATMDLIANSFKNQLSDKEVEDSINKLIKWQVVIERKLYNTYAIHSGSDFDLDQAINEKMDRIESISTSKLNEIAAIQPIIAKQHFHRTGSMRWFDLNLVLSNEIKDFINNTKFNEGSSGQFILSIPSSKKDLVKNVDEIKSLQDGLGENHVFGIVKHDFQLVGLMKDLIALQMIREEDQILVGDDIARKEVNERIVELQSRLEQLINKAINNASWFIGKGEPKLLSFKELNREASILADQLYSETPILRNELLNRSKPSGSAIAAQNLLLKQMIHKEEEIRLGIEGFPAEGGLYESLLKGTRLHVNYADSWQFKVPQTSDDPYNLHPIWQRAKEFLRKHDDRNISTDVIYDIWTRPPFGIKKGLLPLLFISFVLSQKEKIAFYRENVFRSEITDLDIDYMVKDPSCIQIRWVDYQEEQREVLENILMIVRKRDEIISCNNLSSLEIARGLVTIYDKLPGWTKKTSRLSKKTVHLRNILQRANDPNKLLFNDLPKLYKEENNPEGWTTQLEESIIELQTLYTGEINQLFATMIDELELPNRSKQSIVELNERAMNLRGVTGDFKFEAFVGRLSTLQGIEDIEGVISLLVKKPVEQWIDSDLDTAKLSLVKLSRMFIDTESFSRVKGRKAKRHSITISLGLGDNPSTKQKSFCISEHEKRNVEKISKSIQDEIKKNNGTSKKVVLAALADVGYKLMKD